MHCAGKINTEYIGDAMRLLIWFALFVVLIAPLVNADTDTTVMTWVVPSNFSHSIAYGGSCNNTSFYFIESNSEDSDIDGNGGRILPYNASAGGTACQSATVAGMTITNNGNVAINLDANFVTNFSGADVNAKLKVWMGTGSGFCGTGGLGGYAHPCTVVTSTSPVTATTCRDFNSGNATTNVRLVSSLGINDTNQLCFAGLFDSPLVGVAQGSYAHTFDTNAE